MTNKKLLIENMLRYDLDFACKYLLVLYDRQTLDEKQIEQSTHQNQRGFNTADAPILSSIAEILRTGNTLLQSDKMAIGIRMPKYAQQLVPIVKDEELIS